jgi:trk system potassium uptake protein TrkA
VIEADEERADDLAADFPWVEVICGDGTSQNFLKEERLSRFDAVVALTGIDEENLLISIFAGRVGVKKTVTKVNRTDLLQVLDNVGLQAIVTPKQVVADHIVRFVRSVQNSAGNHLEAFYRVADGRAEVLEFQIGPGALCRDIPLSELQTKPNLLITAIIRGEQIIFPAGQDTIRSGDRVIVVTTQQHFQDINDILL